MTGFRIVMVILIAIFGIATGMSRWGREFFSQDQQPVQQAEPNLQGAANVFASTDTKVIRVCDPDTGNLVYIAINTEWTRVASQIAVIEGGCLERR